MVSEPVASSTVEASMKPTESMNYESSAPTVEESKDIDEKNVLKYMMSSAIDYLQRSLAIMIKSAMSRLYGTKETLHELHKMDLQLQVLPKNSKTKPRMKAMYDDTIKKSCRFWKKDSSIAEDWVWHCRQMLPRKNDPQEEWKELSEDLTSWKLDVCLKLIKRAKHDGKQLFASEYMFFKSDVTVSDKYNFVEFAERATEIRNFYAHPPTYTGIIKRFNQDFKAIEEFATKLLHWVSCEDGSPQHILYCQEDVKHVKLKQKGYLNKHKAKWDEVSDALENLNFNEFDYILVSTPCSSRVDVAVTHEELSQLSNIPWAAVVDFDVTSRQDGLLHSLCVPEGRHFQLKMSCQSSSKSSIVPFTYAVISDAGRGELCRDGHIPWIFPHGECQDASDDGCPLADYEEYCSVVHNPLVVAMRKIVSHITQHSSQGAVSVVLCYGSYAYENKRLPYKNFLSDLRYLCGELSVASGHVIILSDSPSLVKYFEPLRVLIFPLDVLCKMLQSKLAFGQDELPPVRMPTSVGFRQVIFEEEDFDLIHEHIAEHEFYKHQVQKKIELRQQSKKVFSDLDIRSSIYDELKERFYKGQKVTWISLNADHAITRREESEITRSIRQMLQERISEKIEPARYVICHSGGAGATTLARKILWHLRMEFPCVILKSNYKHSEGKVQLTSRALKSLYEELQYPILMLIDEEPSFKTIPRLTNFVQANETPVVFLQIQRFDPSESAQQEIKGKDKYILPNALHKEDADNLIHKFYTTFGADKISAGERSVTKMESSVVRPAEEDQVTDFTKNGKITEVHHKKSGLSLYYEVKVLWEDGEEETCCIGSSDSKKFRLVYLKTELKIKINRLYQTFHFYGIMYLDEDFRDPMYEHIKKCLNVMLPGNNPKDDTVMKKLLILGYLSILFAFKVCESIHIKAFEHLCYAVMKSSKTGKFKLEAFIPEAALEFIIITREGQFRIIHPIVAHEILKYFSSISKFPVLFPPSFVCDFLKYMLPEREYQNKEAELAINRLLRYREYVDDGIGYLTKKSFSELILALDKQNQQHAVEVLDYASELINDCHAYGHYARYISKKVGKYKQALEILKLAENLANQCFEEGIVLNIKGDIYRERLENCLKQTNNWNDASNIAFDFHFNACQAYQESFKKHQDEYPLFNELVIRLKLLEAIKKSLKVNDQKFLEFVHCIHDTEVAKSFDTCLDLVKALNEYVDEDEGRDLDGCGGEIGFRNLESRLFSIMGSREKQLKVLHKLITKDDAHVNLPYIRRSYIHLCQLKSNRSMDFDTSTLLMALEKNFESVGYVDKDMLAWLSVTRNMPDIGGNIITIEEKLLMWKRQGPSVIQNKRSIPPINDLILVNYYLMICYFIQLIETKAHALKQFNDACSTTKQESKSNKLRYRMKEWLHNSGTGFRRLRSGPIIKIEMLELDGSMGIPSWQEAHRSRGDKGFPYVTWKGICIWFDAKRYSQHHFKQGDQVKFGVGFTFTGPKAIILNALASDKSGSHATVVIKDEKQQPIQNLNDPEFTYSQATRSSDRHGPKRPKN